MERNEGRNNVDTISHVKEKPVTLFSNLRNWIKSDKNTSRDSPDEKQKKNEQQLNELMNAKNKVRSTN